MPRLRSIDVHLPGERSQVGKALFITQLRDKLHFNFASIKIAHKIENMRLKERLRTAHRRARAEARNSRQRRTARTLNASREYAVQRRKLAMQPHIRRGESQLASQMAAVYYPPHH